MLDVFVAPLYPTYVELNVPSPEEHPELSKIPSSSDIGQNIATDASPTARNSVFLIFAS